MTPYRCVGVNSLDWFLVGPSDGANPRYKKFRATPLGSSGFAKCGGNHLPNGSRPLPNNDKGENQVGQDDYKAMRILHYQKNLMRLIERDYTLLFRIVN
ncbi:MAG: hypothetical protein V3S14_09540, partial [Anaerolineae bacterium]